MNLPKRTFLKLALLFTLLGLALSACDDADEQPYVWNLDCNVGSLIHAIEDAYSRSEPVIINLEADCEYVFTGDLLVSHDMGGETIDSTFKPIVTNVRINGNNAVFIDLWGAIIISFSGNLEVYDLEFRTGNSANVIRNLGGRLYAARTKFIDGRRAIWNSAGTVTVLDSEFTRMGGTGGYNGGAIVNENGSMMIVGSQFTDNSISDWGGAIFNTVVESGHLVISDSVFTGNTSGLGGAIYSNGEGGGENYGFVWVIASEFIQNQASDSGGAIYVKQEREFAISHSKFEGNTTGTQIGGMNIGGAIRNEFSNLTINYSDFIDNRAEICGAIFNEAAPKLTIRNSSFQRNIGDYQNRYGGGAICHIQGELEVVNSEFLSNETARYGGGIYAEESLTIRGTTFSGNTALRGGGIFAGDHRFDWRLMEDQIVDLDITDSTFYDNRATMWGGGIWANQVGNLTINSSTFTQNFADVGGGVHIVDGSMAIVNSTFSGNTAHDGAGFASVYDSSVAITHTTFANNHAVAEGGGFLFSSGVMTIKNSIVANNSPEDCWIGIGAAQFTPAGENLSSDSSCTGFSLFNYNLQLGNLTDNGGPTKTHALPNNSIAVDRAADCANLTADQRGSPRPIGVSCDLGAYEYTGEPMALQIPPPDTPTPTSDLSWIGTVPAEILCYQGPDTAFGVVSSLQANSTVNLVGVSEQGSHVVLDNPRYPGVNCYVRNDQITIAEGVLALLPTLPDPRLPTPTLTIAPPTVTSPPPATGSIGGVVFQDGNSSGSRQGGEIGISGVTVHLGQGACASSGYQSKGTSGNGSFSFTNLPAGTYCLSVNIPLVCGTYSSATTPTQYTINLGPGGSVSKLFGYATFPC